MQLSRFLFLVAFAALPICLISTTWLYLYPLLHGCAFPAPEASQSTSTSANPVAPFRLLALGDPQLEGDSSLPIPGAKAFPSLQWLERDLRRAAGDWRIQRDILLQALKRAITNDLPKWLEGYRKRLDLWGNDLYLAHIVRQLRWWTRPTHVAVLGDLLGSQWVSDAEFARRADRYWGTVFRGMEKVPDEVMVGSEEEGEGRKWGGSVEVLGEDEEWEKRVINIAGNHDVGYAGDLDEGRIERFEREFGRVNWDLSFELPWTIWDDMREEEEEDKTEVGSTVEGNTGTGAAPTQYVAPTKLFVKPPRRRSSEPPVLRLVILNSMNLDTPALSQDLQRETYDFMTHVISTSRPVTDKTHATVLLTHIPLHKKPGTCTDEPFFDFFDSGAGIKEQNMLSPHASKVILESIFGLSGNPEAEGRGLGRRGIIINGHDHAGCDVVHYISKESFPCPPSELYRSMPTCSPPCYLPSYEEKFGKPYINRTENPEWHTWRVPAWDASPLHPTQHTTLRDCLGFERTPGLREITLRSMMGDFSGYAGFLSAWFDESLGEVGEWRIEFATCGVGVQHWWWAVHVTDLITLLVLGAGVLAKGIEHAVGKRGEGKSEQERKKGGKKRLEVGQVVIKKKTTVDGVVREQREKSLAVLSEGK